VRPEEYAALARTEAQHWFYTGKRDIVRHWIWKFKDPSKGLRLLDCGAGSGAFAAEMCGSAQVVAMDDHQESLRLLGDRVSKISTVGGSCVKIPFPSNCFDIVTALDVLEHIPDDRAAATEMLRVLKPGGLLVLTVPALMSLWSDWDEALHHQRRYRKEGLLRLLRPLPIDCLHAAYINILAVPAIWMIRKARLLGLAGTGKRAEDWIPPGILNLLLRFVYVSLGKSRIQFPFGVGLLLVGVKGESTPSTSSHSIAAAKQEFPTA
jgi:SAM-dependent methyltransferase